MKHFWRNAKIGYRGHVSAINFTWRLLFDSDYKDMVKRCPAAAIPAWVVTLLALLFWTPFTYLIVGPVGAIVAGFDRRDIEEEDALWL